MAVSRPFEQPALPVLPASVRRPLAAAWISLALHAALVALVHVSPPTAFDVGESVIEARLMPVPAASPQPPAETVPEAAPPAEPEPAPPPPVPVALQPVPGPQIEPAPVHRPVPENTPALAPEPATPAPSVAAAPPAPPPAPVPVAITSAVDLTYYKARELDEQPRAMRRIVPEYPPGPDRDRISGTVQLKLKLEADGRVSEVEVVRADPPGLFEDSAVQAFRKARFRPAKRGGQPVRALILVEVVYDWDGRQ